MRLVDLPSGKGGSITCQPCPLAHLRIYIATYLPFYLATYLPTLLHRAEREAAARLSRELADQFGIRGAQAFVLRGAVAQLERLANRFLALLSDGGLRLRLTLDGERIVKDVSPLG